MLVDWGWLEKTEERDGYKFVVELLRRWISKKHSLENAKRELESISKRAIRDYTYARQAHIDGDLEIAVESYRRALAANPNHAGAQLGLAQALHEQGLIEEAVTDDHLPGFKIRWITSATSWAREALNSISSVSGDI